MKTSLYPRLILIAVVSSMLLVSCEKSEKLPSEPVPINLTLKGEMLVNSGNEFAFDIFKKILDDTPAEKNVIFSPLSISYALSMTVNGAAGPTRDSILKALRLHDISVEDLNSNYNLLTKALLSVDKRVAISIANSVWVENNFVVKEPFMKALTDFYNAEARNFDISNPLTPDAINEWIESKTNGLIKKMIDGLSDNTVMLLINAIYFKGQWKMQFEKSATAPRQFMRGDGSIVQAQAMNQTAGIKYYSNYGFSVAEFPYGQGNYVMDVILPNGLDLTDLKASLSESAYNTWVSNMHEANLNVYMPRYKFGYKNELKPILASMGMGIAFGNADFSGITDDNIFISSVLHQAFIETNEEGTEAAAVTVVTFETTSAGPHEPYTFDINKPFLFVIRETTTNSILFMGKVNDPTAE
ncbi:MAG: serpin family protein [Bacteroidales bacterium]